MIGLTGSHRTGKTTLAKQIEEELGIEYVTLSVSDVIRESTGVECSQISSMDQRLKAQRRLVEACDKTFLRRKGMFISDRTPIDVAAYTMGDACQDMTAAQQKEMLEIIDDCVDITNSSFQTLLLVQPGIPFIEEPGKPKMNMAYQELIHSLCLGLLSDQRTTVEWWFVNRNCTDQTKRMDAFKSILDTAFEDVSYEAEAAAFLH